MRATLTVPVRVAPAAGDVNAHAGRVDAVVGVVVPVVGVVPVLELEAPVPVVLVVVVVLDAFKLSPADVVGVE